MSLKSKQMFTVLVIAVLVVFSSATPAGAAPQADAASSPLQIKIGDGFRLTYADVVDRKPPTRFLDLLECLERDRDWKKVP